MSESTPQPPILPLPGNIHNVDFRSPNQSFEHLVTRDGEISKLQVLGTETIFVASQKLCHELCNDNASRTPFLPHSSNCGMSLDQRYVICLHSLLQVRRSGAGSALGSFFVNPLQDTKPHLACSRLLCLVSRAAHCRSFRPDIRCWKCRNLCLLSRSRIPVSRDAKSRPKRLVISSINGVQRMWCL